MAYKKSARILLSLCALFAACPQAINGLPHPDPEIATLTVPEGQVGIFLVPTAQPTLAKRDPEPEMATLTVPEGQVGIFLVPTAAPNIAKRALPLRKVAAPKRVVKKPAGTLPRTRQATAVRAASTRRPGVRTKATATRKPTGVRASTGRPTKPTSVKASTIASSARATATAAPVCALLPAKWKPFLDPRAATKPAKKQSTGASPGAARLQKRKPTTRAGRVDWKACTDEMFSKEPPKTLSYNTALDMLPVLQAHAAGGAAWTKVDKMRLHWPQVQAFYGMNGKSGADELDKCRKPSKLAKLTLDQALTNPDTGVQGTTFATVAMTGVRNKEAMYNVDHIYELHLLGEFVLSMINNADFDCTDLKKTFYNGTIAKDGSATWLDRTSFTINERVPWFQQNKVTMKKMRLFDILMFELPSQSKIEDKEKNTRVAELALTNVFLNNAKEKVFSKKLEKHWETLGSVKTKAPAKGTAKPETITVAASEIEKFKARYKFLESVAMAFDFMRHPDINDKFGRTHKRLLDVFAVLDNELTADPVKRKSTTNGNKLIHNNWARSYDNWMREHIKSIETTAEQDVMEFIREMVKDYGLDDKKMATATPQAKQMAQAVSEMAASYVADKTTYTFGNLIPAVTIKDHPA